MFVAMLSSTVVTNALPRIVTDLHGSQTGYTWVVVATMLAMTATTPIWGKLADLFSKKLLVQSALVIYSVGSLIAAFAPSMEVLIGARVGPGPRRRRPDRAGPGRDRDDGLARASAAATPATSARPSPLATVSGPLIGGLIVDSPLGWRGCFFIGLPFAVLAFSSSRRPCTCRSIKRAVHIDYLGATLIVAGVSHAAGLGLAGRQPVRLGLARPPRSWCRRRCSSSSPRSYVEAQVAVDPIIPMRLFRDRTTSPGDRRLGDDRRRDVRLDGLPQPVLPDRPRDDARPRPA